MAQSFSVTSEDIKIPFVAYFTFILFTLLAYNTTLKFLFAMKIFFESFYRWLFIQGQNNTQNTQIHLAMKILLKILNVDKEFSLEILNGARKIPISATHNKFVNLYKKSWEHKPDERPDIDQVILELNSIDLKC
ncbi:13218_t:CDS:2 [Funneliformis caledonium]|uniref:13218_t:CDS:1 n=1 Tax=Funneliformis caledonium TaxID=1117310 RepID=A0A9N9CEM7_9GLOM|nr:13218_t:CDS:2 [Funneliformis caledonium]